MWERVKKYLEELKKGNKKISRDAMLILFLCGILLYVITLPINNNNSYYKKKHRERRNRKVNRNTVKIWRENWRNFFLMWKVWER